MHFHLLPPRYHYNVNTSRLLVHVQKGWEDGLYISCVSSCQNLWAIVMDAGTEFTQQIYKVRRGTCRPAGIDRQVVNLRQRYFGWRHSVRRMRAPRARVLQARTV